MCKFIIIGGIKCFWGCLWYLCFYYVSILFFVEIRYVLASLTIFSIDFSTLSTMSIFSSVQVIDATSLSFFCFFEGIEAWFSSISSTFVFPEHRLFFIQNYQLQVFTFHYHCYPTWDQLKLTKYSLPCWHHNQFKVLIMLPKLKRFLKEVNNYIPKLPHIKY